MRHIGNRTDILVQRQNRLSYRPLLVESHAGKIMNYTGDPDQLNDQIVRFIVLSLSVIRKTKGVGRMHPANVIGQSSP